MRRSKRYHAHDEGNQYKVGDVVRPSRSARPKSKLKHWEVTGKAGEISAAAAESGLRPKHTPRLYRRATCSIP